MYGFCQHIAAEFSNTRTARNFLEEHEYGFPAISQGGIEVTPSPDIAGFDGVFGAFPAERSGRDGQG